MKGPGGVYTPSRTPHYSQLGRRMTPWCWVTGITGQTVHALREYIPFTEIMTHWDFTRARRTRKNQDVTVT